MKNIGNFTEKTPEMKSIFLYSCRFSPTTERLHCKWFSGNFAKFLITAALLKTVAAFNQNATNDTRKIKVTTTATTLSSHV